MLRHLGGESPHAVTDAVPPRTDLVETPENFLLYMELPGVPKDQVHVRMKDEVLTVTGVPRQDRTEDRKMLRREFEHAPFHRHIMLSRDRVNIDSISAHLNNGVLSVTIPKRPAGRNLRRRIPVQRIQ